MRTSAKVRLATLALGGAAIAAWGAWSMAPFHAARPAPGASPAEFRRHLDARVPGLLARFGAPGVSIATVTGAEPGVTAAYGLADVAHRRPVTPDTLFEAASISKSVSAWAVMGLVQSGRMELDAPIATYLGDWPLPPAPYPKDAVTVRRVLRHLAGINPGNIGVRRPDEPAQTTLGLLRGEGRNPAIRTSGAARLVQPVDQGFLYSNPGYLLLQLAVERRTGQPLKSYMKQAVLDPLGMTASTFDWDESLRPRLATPYLSDGRADVLTIRDDAANGSLITTAPDLAKFLAAEMRPGAAAAGRLTAASLAQLFDGAVPLPRTQVQGMGSDRGALGHYVERLTDGRTAIMNGGFSPGWTSQFYLVPASGDGLAVLTNSDRGRPVIAEIAADWAAWRGLPPLKMTTTFARVATIGPLVIGALAMTGLMLITGVIADLVERRCELFPRTPWRGAASLGRLIAAGALGYAWFGVARMTLKFAFPWLDVAATLAVTLVAIGLVARALLPRRPSRPAVEADLRLQDLNS